MGGDDLFILILCVVFAVVSVLALKGQRGSPPPVTGADQPDGDDRPGHRHARDGGGRTDGRQ